MEPCRILFVGGATSDLNTVARRDALVDLGFHVESIDPIPSTRDSGLPSLDEALHARRGGRAGS